jgi:succinate-semialdehyde dehydrogenase / glutarate-semialdehyde dehydrogenase
MPAFDEELFGPVASVIRVKDEKEAIRIANGTSFGLGAAIFFSEPEKGRADCRKAASGRLLLCE